MVSSVIKQNQDLLKHPSTMLVISIFSLTGNIAIKSTLLYDCALRSYLVDSEKPTTKAFITAKIGHNLIEVRRITVASTVLLLILERHRQLFKASVVPVPVNR